MPPPPILDLTTLDCEKVLYTREEIYRVLPQQFEFSQLDGIIHLDKGEKVYCAGFRDVRPDEWWCRGHMPGNPIFPGVLMVECAAQLAAFAQYHTHRMDEGFLGFGGIDAAKFRGSVIPPTRILLMGSAVEVRPRRFVYDVQSFCKGAMVFEGRITGMPIRP